MKNACYSLKWKILAQNPHQIAAEYKKTILPRRNVEEPNIFLSRKNRCLFFRFCLCHSKMGWKFAGGQRCVLSPRLFCNVLHWGKVGLPLAVTCHFERTYASVMISFLSHEELQKKGSIGRPGRQIAEHWVGIDHGKNSGFNLRRSTAVFRPYTVPAHLQSQNLLEAGT